MIVAVLVLGMAAAANAPAPGTVQGRLTRSYTQHLAAPPGEVFPLLGPVGEKKWGGEGWTPRFIYPVGGADEAGCVFATGAPDAETIWMLTTFDRTAGRVEYVQMTPGMRVTRLQIDLRPEGSEARRRRSATHGPLSPTRTRPFSRCTPGPPSTMRWRSGRGPSMRISRRIQDTRARIP